MRTLLMLSLALPVLACGGVVESSPNESGEDALVGGSPESRFLAAGYLTADGSSNPLCGATLIAPNIAVTAAHCVYRNRNASLRFGVGELKDKRQIAVKEIHYHPEAHMEAKGIVDFVHTLLLNDLAYVILEKSVPNVPPVILPTAKPKWMSCDIELIGYGKVDSSDLERTGVGGCVLLNPKLGSDQIIEIRPDKGGAVCHRDGDEGHAALRARKDGRAELVGIYVGSVTQSTTDCRRYLQFLNGYEESSGHADFYAEALTHAKI